MDVDLPQRNQPYWKIIVIEYLACIMLNMNGSCIFPEPCIFRLSFMGFEFSIDLSVVHHWVNGWDNPVICPLVHI